MKTGAAAVRHCHLAAVPALAILLCVIGSAPPTAARTLEGALVSAFPGVLHADAQGLARVFTRSVAASYPVTGTSASYAYRFDPASDSFQRLNIPLGPVLSERAETLGSTKLSVSLNYVLVEYDATNGRNLDALVSNDPNGPGDHIAICGDLLCEPAQGSARLDIEAQIVSLAVTYGVTPDLDVSVSLPLVRTFLRASTSFTGPDPRVPRKPNFFDFDFRTNATKTAVGVGDLLLRSKYLFTRRPLADLAAGLLLSVPTGEQANFHGTGDTLLGVTLYASRVYAQRIEPHLNLGFVLNADKFDRSQVRYSAGADTRILDWLTLNNDFIGRSDVARPDTIERPVFLQIERADVFAFSCGLKLAPLRRTVFFFNALLPLNDDSVTSDHVLTLGVESIF